MLKQKAPKAKKCKVCPAEFVPRKMGQKVCGIACAKIQGRADRQKAVAKKARADVRALNERDPQWQKAKAQEAFNAFIRYRDKDLPCISCDNTTRQMHAGHYIAIGANESLRFEELNCHKQCSICNNFKSANKDGYRPALILKIGQDKFDWLTGPHDPKRYRLQDYIDIKIHYRQALKELKDAEAG